MDEFQVEPNWKELATRYREERDAARKEAREFKKMYSELAKKWNDNVSTPCLATLKWGYPSIPQTLISHPSARFLKGIARFGVT
jgi:hypothetical protein